MPLLLPPLLLPLPLRPLLRMPGRLAEAPHFGEPLASKTCPQAQPTAIATATKAEMEAPAVAAAAIDVRASIGRHALQLDSLIPHRFSP